jgi:Carboxypeptidase regulatory-like domain
MKSLLRRGLLITGLSVSAVVLGMTLSAIVGQTAKADELYGRVRGIVSDSTGAVVSGAEVKITNKGTGVSRDARTDQNGAYEFVNLPVGIYSVSVNRTGFRTVVVDNINLTQDQVYVNNVTLEVGSVSETVMVAATQAQVEQTNIQLTADIDAKTITDLPLIGRNWVNLQQTLPGVVTPDTRFGTNFATNGSQAQQNSYLINGNDFNDLPLNSPLTPPNPDTIAEVKFVTNSLNPEFGRNSGAVLNAVTKSGTNNFHGTGFWFYRDSFLQTKNFFQLTAPPIHQNQFGGTIGGPILKNKVFAFYGLQILRGRIPDNNFFGGTNLGQLPTVFTPAQLSGTWNAANLSTNVIPKNLSITGPAGPCPAGTTWKACFAGGVVPTSNYNALSAQLVKQFVPPANDGSLFSFNPVTQSKVDQHVGRLDWNITQKDVLWFYGYANDSSQLNAIPFSGATLPGFGDGSIPFTKQFTSSWNHTFTGNVLNEFRVGYTRLNFPTGQPQNVRQPSAFGFPNIFPQLKSGADLPQMAITGYFTIGGTNNGPQPRKDQTYQVTDNFSWIKGHHSFKFGYDGRKFQVWNPFAASNDGAFTYNTAGTYSTGDAGLDFLLGIPASYLQGSGSIIIAQSYEHYLYFQDQWKVRNNLTVTYGTGFQIDTPISEYQQGGISRFCFQPGVQSTVFPTAPLGYTVSGDTNCTTSGLTRTKYHFGPRLGFAYSPGGLSRFTGGPGKTSIRAGIGIYYNRSEEEINLQDLGIPPFGLTSTGAGDTGGSPSFPDPWTDINGGGTLANKFPFTQPGKGAAVNFTPFFPMGSGLNTSSKDFTTPRAANYNLTLERELPAATLLRIGYVGAAGKRLNTSLSFNPATPAGVQACLANPACSSNPLGQPTAFPSHYAFDGSIWGQPGIQANEGWSHYNALQVTVEKHLSHGLQFLSAYTWSHSLDVSSSFENVAFQLAGSFDPYGRFRNDYGSSAFDVRHRWVISGTYEIPSLHKVWAFAPDRVFGGWQLSAINTLQSGFPLFLEATSVPSLTCSWQFSFYGCPDRPQLVSFPKVLDPRNVTTFRRKGNYWFDPASFTDAPLGQLGNVSRGFFHGPGFTNLDFAIEKNTKITEATNLQLRLEAYNAFNHTNFGTPNNNVDSSRFGLITSIRSFTNSRLVQLGAKFTF